MTRSEAIAKVAALTPLGSQDMEGFLQLVETANARHLAGDDSYLEQVGLLIDTYRRQGITPDRTAWDVVVEVLKTTAELAGYALPVLGAVEGVFGMAAAIKGA